MNQLWRSAIVIMRTEIHKQVHSKDGQLLEDNRFITKSDEEGKVLWESGKNLKNKDKTRVEYWYEEGRVAGKKFYVFGVHESTTEMSYDDAGVLIEELTLNADGDELLRFNRNGNRATQIIKDETGAILESKEIHNDENNNPIREIEDEGAYITELEYDGKNLTHLKIIEDGKTTLEETYLFDDNGNEIKSEGIDSVDESRVLVERIFDEYNKLIKEVQFENDQLFSTVTCTYDDQNRLIEKKNVMREQTEVSKYSYSD